jgi:hypothetical protein
VDIPQSTCVDWVLNGWYDTAVQQPIDAETQKAMMSFYHKKQEEMKVRAHIPLPDSPFPATWTSTVSVAPRWLA